MVCSASQPAYTFLLIGRFYMERTLPYITAALLCENVLEEKNGSLTVVRIVDRLEFSTEGLPPELNPMVALKGLVCLKSGPYQGDCNITIKVNRPSGRETEPMSFPPFKLLGGDQGQNVIINIGLGVDEQGPYWFDVNLNGELLTRIPLMVVRVQKPVLEKSL